MLVWMWAVCDEDPWSQHVSLIILLCYVLALRVSHFHCWTHKYNVTFPGGKWWLHNHFSCAVQCGLYITVTILKIVPNNHISELMQPMDYEMLLLTCFVLWESICMLARLEDWRPIDGNQWSPSIAFNQPWLQGSSSQTAHIQTSM